jgi:hypothetical protein
MELVPSVVPGEDAVVFTVFKGALETERRMRGYGSHPDGRILLLEATGDARPRPRVIFGWRGVQAR